MTGTNGDTTEVELVTKLRGWAEANREQAEAKSQALDVPDADAQEQMIRFFSGFSKSEAERDQNLATASAFKAAAHGNQAAADALEAVAELEDAIASAIEQKAPSS